MRKLMKIICISVLVIIMTLTSIGCESLLTKNNPTEDAPILAGDTSEKKPLSCMVYFRLPSQDYLAGQLHLVSVPETKRVEEVILQELISGPKSKVTSLKPVINPNTRIVSVSDNGGLLFVTLSSQFLEPLSDIPENWQDNEVFYLQVMAQRRLALAALVNTLTQTGKYSKIQLYIDYDDSGQGQRPTRGEVGYIDENSEQFLEPIGRNADYIYSPDVAVKEFLTSFSEKNWTEAANYVAVDSSTSSGKSDLVSKFLVLDLTIIEYEITSITTLYDGQSAIVTLDYFAKSKDGSEYNNTNLSLLINLVDDIWKISSVSINQFLSTSNG